MTTLGLNLMPIRMAIIKKTTNKHWWRCGGKGNSHAIGKNVNWCSHYGKQYRNYSKNKYITTIWSSYSTFPYKSKYGKTNLKRYLVALHPASLKVAQPQHWGAWRQWKRHQWFATAVPNLFGTTDQFHGRQTIFAWTESWGRWFLDDSSTLQLFCTLFLI